MASSSSAVPVEAPISKSSTFFAAVLFDQTDNFRHLYGSLPGLTKLRKREFALELSFNVTTINTKGHAFPSFLGIKAKLPSSGVGRNAPPGHVIDIKVYGTGTTRLEACSVNRDDPAGPPHLTKSSQMTCLFPADGKSKLIKLTLEYNTKGVSCEGLFVPPSAAHTSTTVMNVLKTLFGSDVQDGTLVLYLQDESFAPVESRVAGLMARFKEDNTHEDGPFFNRFYMEDAEVAHLQYGKMPLSDSRPVVKYEYTSPINVDITTAMTPYGLAVVELDEYQKGTAKAFGRGSFELRAIKVKGAGNLVYMALLKPLEELLLRPKEGDRMQITIKGKDDLTKHSPFWNAAVVSDFSRNATGAIHIYLYRPRQAFPSTMSDAEKERTIMPYMDMDLPCVEVENSKDEVAVTAALKSAPVLNVGTKVTVTQTTARRQCEAILALRRGERRVWEADKNFWEDDEAVKAFAQFVLFKTSIPKSTSNWLGDGVRFVKHLNDFDQRNVIDNLFCNAPSPVGVLVGPAGTGKTVLMSNIIRAHVLAHGSTHIIGTPSNVASDVAAQVIYSIFQKEDSLKGKIVLRALFENAEEKLLFGSAEQEKSTTMKIRYPENIQYALDHQLAPITQLETESIEDVKMRVDVHKWHFMQDNDGNPIPIPANIGKPRRKLEAQGLAQLKSDIGMFRGDGTLDADALEARSAIKDLISIVRIVRDNRPPTDPRMECWQQSLAYNSLRTAGFARFPSNDFTADFSEKCTEFRASLETILDNGNDALSDEAFTQFRHSMVDLYAYTISKATVLIGTLTCLASPIYVRNFKNKSTFWTDEAGQCSVPDWLNVIARYQYDQAFLLGDPHQLCPVVVGPSPLTGFMPILEVSPMKLVLDAKWPSVLLCQNRRSAKGIIQIPSKLFYEGGITEHANSMDYIGSHIYTKPVGDSMSKFFSRPGQPTLPSAVAYFNSPTSAERDPATSSWFNKGNLAFCTNLIEHCVAQLGVPPSAIGYSSPYNAQCLRLKQALSKLQLEYKNRGINHDFAAIKIASIDSFQGGSRKVFIGDFTASDKLGFMKAEGRNCVLLTRAEDYALYIGSRKLRGAHRDTNYVSMAFDKAVEGKVCRELEVNEKWLSHKVIS